MDRVIFWFITPNAIKKKILFESANKIAQSCTYSWHQWSKTLEPDLFFVSTHRKRYHNRTGSIHKPTQSHLAPLSAERLLLSRFHLLQFVQSQPPRETDSFKITPSHGKTLSEDPERITGHHTHVFTLLLLGLNKTPPQLCQGQDYCLVTGLDVSVCRLIADVGGRCVSTAEDSLLFLFHFHIQSPVYIYCLISLISASVFS